MTAYKIRGVLSGMNAYDFDKTIYPGDSATHFWLFCLRRRLGTITSAFRALVPLSKGLTGRLSRGDVKQALYSCLSSVPDARAEAAAFWDTHIDRIYPWYLDRKREDDLIISASPEFLIEEACRRLGVRYIATPLDIRTGRILGENCRGEEKVRRVREEYGEETVEEFYSDSFADRPMMELAERGYLVKNGAVVRLVEKTEGGGTSE